MHILRFYIFNQWLFSVKKAIGLELVEPQVSRRYWPSTSSSRTALSLLMSNAYLRNLAAKK